MNRIRALAASLALALLLVADAARALSPFPLTETVWAWHSTGGGDNGAAALASPERYTFQLLGDGTVRVRADCNRGGGRYEANDVELRFGPIATTKKGCPAGSRGREFLDALAKTERYRFEGVELVLAPSDGSRAFRFRPATK